MKYSHHSLRKKKSSNRLGAMILFAAFFLFSFPAAQAQQSLNASNSIQILADQLNVKAYPNGTFNSESAFLKLNEEMDKMSNDFSRGLKYRYYWLVAVDVKRSGFPLEESLLKNINKVGKEFGVPNSTLQKLYQKTITML